MRLPVWAGGSVRTTRRAERAPGGQRFGWFDAGLPLGLTWQVIGPILGLVFLGAIAAIHSTAAPYIGTGGTIIQRDFWWRYVRKQSGTHSEQIWTNRLFATILAVAAVLIGALASSACTAPSPLARAASARVAAHAFSK